MVKCVDNVDFLGHQLQQGLIGLHEDNVGKIRDAPRPNTKKPIRSFLGLAGYYRDFIPNFLGFAAPLSDPTRKGQQEIVDWGEAHERASRTIKKEIDTQSSISIVKKSKKLGPLHVNVPVRIQITLPKRQANEIRRTV